jgi:hypothetical protein
MDEIFSIHVLKRWIDTWDEIFSPSHWIDGFIISPSHWIDE